MLVAVTHLVVGTLFRADRGVLETLASVELYGDYDA